VFDLVRRVGSVPQADLELTLNCGVGMVAVTDPDDADAAIAALGEHGVRAWVAGDVRVAESAQGELGGRVELVGQHPGW
jgi:phosphoribosylformylglycinamidine cyclo-ligase